jgi:nitric oxide reductase large subunit
MQTYNTNYPYKRGDRLPPAKAKRRFPILSFMFLLLMIGSLVFIKAALTKPTGQASIIP